MNNLVLSFINCMIYIVYGIIIGILVFEDNTAKKKDFIIVSIIFPLYYQIIKYLFSSFYINFLSCLGYFLSLSYLFKKDYFSSLCVTFIAFTFKTFYIVTILFAINRCNMFSISDSVLKIYEFGLNCIVGFCLLALVFLLKKSLVAFMKFLKKNKYSYFFMGFVLLIEVNIVTILDVGVTNLNASMLDDFALIIFVIFIFCLSLIQENKYENIRNYYDDLFEYSRSNEEQINEYKRRLHENKNKFIYLKSILNCDKKEISAYIDTVLKEEFDISRQWVGDLNYLPIPGVKNFINYKLLKLKEMGAVLEIVVSPSIADIKTNVMEQKNQNDLCTLLGVILDNMTDSLKTQKNKLASLQIYKIDDIVYSEFANSFEGIIDLDKIRNFGYSTKGKNRGVGLSLVKDIVDDNPMLDVKTRVVDNFFVQTIIIDLKKSKILNEEKKKYGKRNRRNKGKK